MWEEVNVIESGSNYGWPLKEGTHCHDPQLGTTVGGDCLVESDRGEPLIDPVLEFPHFDEAGDAVGFAVIGGHIHSGSVAALSESYLFGIYTSSFSEAAGRLIAATPQDSGQWPMQELQIDGGLDIQVLSLGQDGADTYVLGTRAALSENPLSTGGSGLPTHRVSLAPDTLDHRIFYTLDHRIFWTFSTIFVRSGGAARMPPP